MIVNTDTAEYIRRRGSMTGPGKWNGAYYYSLEICRNIIPNVQTDRSWITVNAPGAGAEDGAIVFIHNNIHTNTYDWLAKYKDLVLVCGIPETVEKVEHLGTAVYLPISIDVNEVTAHKAEKTRDRAYVGRPSKRSGIQLAPGTDFIEGMPRERLLDEIARYREVYAVGRCALEAKALGCRILPFDPRFPDPERWQVIDNREAAAQLQRILDDIEGGNQNK